MSQVLARPSFYTEDNYYNLPENVRAELIDGPRLLRSARLDY